MPIVEPHPDLSCSISMSTVFDVILLSLAVALTLPIGVFVLECLLALLPASATLIGIVVLQQIPTLRELAGIVLVAVGVAGDTERATEQSQPH